MAIGLIKAVFFDLKDTLGYIDRPGHLVTYKPSTADLLETVRQPLGLRIGVITNLPRNVSSEAGRQMVEEAGIAPFLDPDGFITNHDAGIDKPDPRIFRYAAERLGLTPEECLFVGENFAEVLGAQAAGMRAQLKPCPPGREFLLKPVAARASTEKDSGRLSELLMEEEHLIGRRLVIAAATISKKLSAGELPVRPMGLLVYLLTEFIDRYHHAVEERVLLPLAFAYGFSPKDAAYVFDDHERGRAYFRTLEAALARIRNGDQSAVGDFRTTLDAFVALYREHARRENDETLPQLGACLGAYEDAVIVDLIDRYGPGDLGPWLALIADMETQLGLSAGGPTMPEIKTIGVLAYHRCGEQDTLVPYEILKHTSMVVKDLQKKTLEVKLLRVNEKDPELIEMQMGTKVMSEGALGSEDLFDLFFVPGGLGSGEAAKNTRILEAVKRHHQAGKVIATNCSGISILHRAGILGDTPVTAAATVARRLKAEGAKLIEPRTMWAGKKNGTIWTSAGGSGVHGSTVAMICNYFGREVGEYIGMGWDTYPALGERIFDERGPQYLSFPELEAGIQDALEEMLLPKK